MKHWYIYLLILPFLFSCRSTKLREVDKTSDNSVRIEYKTKVDSVFIHNFDSVFVKQANDTIYIFREKTNTVFKSVFDTIFITDTLRIADTKIIQKSEEKTVNFASKLKDILIIVTLLVIGVFISRFLR